MGKEKNGHKCSCGRAGSRGLSELKPQSVIMYQPGSIDDLVFDIIILKNDSGHTMNYPLAI